MGNIRINRNLLKVVYRHGENMENFRLYTIGKCYFACRSGIFSLDEFCDILHRDFSYKSLHKRPGNKRKIFKTKLLETFRSSFLFRETTDGRFILNSERRLLQIYKGTSKSSWYEVPDCSIVLSKREFTDFCMGMLLSGNKFRSNKKLAEYCGCTVRRVQLATSRNHRQKTFIKQFNFIDDFTGTKQEVQRVRAKLFNVHGISSPKPVPYKGEWILRLNAPNSYRSFVLSGVKGFVAQPPKQGVRKGECWFKPVRQKEKQLRLFGDESKRWVFNRKVYSINDYLVDNSIFLN